MSGKPERRSKRKRKRTGHSLSQKTLGSLNLDFIKTEDDADATDTSVCVSSMPNQPEKKSKRIRKQTLNFVSQENMLLGKTLHVIKTENAGDATDNSIYGSSISGKPVKKFDKKRTVLPKKNKSLSKTLNIIKTENDVDATDTSIYTRSVPSKPERKSKRKRKQTLNSLPKENMFSEKTLDIIKIEDDVDVTDTSINISSMSGKPVRKSKRKRNVNSLPQENISLSKTLDILKTEDDVDVKPKSSKPRKNSKRKQNVHSISHENKRLRKTLNVTKTDVDAMDTSICAKLESQLSDMDESSTKVVAQITNAANPVEILNRDIKIDIKNELSVTCSSKDRTIPIDSVILNILRKKLNCSETDAGDMCLILSEHFVKILKKVLGHGKDYMKICGRVKFLVDDFYRGLFICKEWDFNEPHLTVQKLNFFNDSSENYTSFEGKWLENNNLVHGGVPNIPVQLQVYFIEVTTVLLSEEEELCSVVCRNLETNLSLLKLVPYFVKFLSECIISLISNFLKVSTLLKAMKSLLFNSHLHFFNDSDLTTLADTLLKFLFSDLPHTVENNIDCWYLKDNAAYLLKQVLKKSRSITLMLTVINKIEAYFSEFTTHSFISQYGAIAAVNSIGVITILRFMSLHFDKYFEYINQTYPNCERHHICMVEGQLVNAYSILIRHFFNYEFDHTKKSKHFPAFLKRKVFPFLSKINFGEYFGDTLTQHFPLSNFVSFNGSFKKNAVKSRKKCKRFYVNGNVIKKESTCKKNLVSREQIFDVVPLKCRTIKFGKTNVTK